jgi:hypothetical protein
LPVSIINAKPVYFLCKVRLPSLSPVKACFQRVAEKIFLSALPKAYFSHHPWPDCLSIFGQKKSTFWQKDVRPKGNK